jgi:hypothetical protein
MEEIPDSEYKKCVSQIQNYSQAYNGKNPLNFGIQKSVKRTIPYYIRSHNGLQGPPVFA